MRTYTMRAEEKRKKKLYERNQEKNKSAINLLFVWKYVVHVFGHIYDTYYNTHKNITVENNSFQSKENDKWFFSY